LRDCSPFRVGRLLTGESMPCHVDKVNINFN
jgi:hypothetical protein